MLRIERTLLPRSHPLYRAGLELALERAGADEAAWHRVDLDAEPLRLAQAVGQLPGLDGTQLDHGVIGSILAPARSADQAGALQIEVGGVEAEDLAKVGVERVEAQRHDHRVAVLVGTVSF